MSGIQEILVIVLIVAVIIFLPNRMGKSAKKPSKKILQALSGKIRMAVIASGVWLLLWTTYFKPWTGEILAFTLVGLFPVIVGWGVIWIVDGFKKKQEN